MSTFTNKPMDWLAGILLLTALIVASYLKARQEQNIQKSIGRWRSDENRRGGTMPITINGEYAKNMNISPCRKCGAFPRIWSMNYPEIQWIGCTSCDISHRWGAYNLEEMIMKWEVVNSADENIVNYLVSEPGDYVFFESKDLAMQYMQCVGEVGRTLIAIDKYGEELGKDVSGAMKTAKINK